MAGRGRDALPAPENALQRLIYEACTPLPNHPRQRNGRIQPREDLNFEITDQINAKPNPLSGDAAMAAVHLANHRNRDVAMLALQLLDACAINCWFPFWLAISRKEFLNELVRRFPERPPYHYSEPMQEALKYIEKWRSTICTVSRFERMLGHIRDMHRLLQSKGYMFPHVPEEERAVLMQDDRLKSAQELEQEEKAFQEAKFAELIRRATPADLQEANQLAKLMTGHDTKNQTDYRAKAAEEVGKVQEKAKLLEDMLQQYKPGDKNIESDSAEELANALGSARVKIQQMCQTESEDQEAVSKLIQINDSINRTLERYRLIKNGDVESASRIPKGSLGTSGAGVSTGPGNELSLIDFGPEESETPAAGASQNASGGLEDDLLGLSLQAPAQQTPGAIFLGGSAAGAAPTPPSAPSPAPPPKSNYDLLGAFQQPAQQPPTHPQPQAPVPKDPFAALSSLSSAPRQPSPFQFQQSVPPPNPNNDILSKINASKPVPQPPAHNNGVAGGADDDDWAFSSALPDQAREIVVTNTEIHAVFLVSKPPGSSEELLVKSSISNNTPSPVSDLTFQLAVQKGYHLTLEPQSSRTLQPSQRAGITQIIHVQNSPSQSSPAPPGGGGGGPIKVRWKASYWVGGQQREERGEIANLRGT